MAYKWSDKWFSIWFSIIFVLALFIELSGIVFLNALQMIIGVLLFIMSLVVILFDKQNKIEKTLLKIATINTVKETVEGTKKRK